MEVMGRGRRRKLRVGEGLSRGRWEADSGPSDDVDELFYAVRGCILGSCYRYELGALPSCKRDIH